MNYETMSTYELGKLCLQRLGYTWQPLTGLAGFLVNGDFSAGFINEAEAWRMRSPATSANDALWLLENCDYKHQYRKGVHVVMIFDKPRPDDGMYDDPPYLGVAQMSSFQLAATIAFLRATEEAVHVD